MAFNADDQVTTEAETHRRLPMEVVLRRVQKPDHVNLEVLVKFAVDGRRLQLHRIADDRVDQLWTTPAVKTFREWVRLIIQEAAAQ